MCHHVTAQYFALNKWTGHQLSVNQLKWRLDCKWSAAKEQICSGTLLWIRIWGPAELRQQSQSRKSHDCDNFLGKLVPFSRLISKSHHDNTDKNTSPYCQCLQTTVHGWEPAFCLPFVFLVRVMWDSATQPGCKREWDTTNFASCLDPELHILMLWLFVAANGRVFKSLSVSKH